MNENACKLVLPMVWPLSRPMRSQPHDSRHHHLREWYGTDPTQKRSYFGLSLARCEATGHYARDPHDSRHQHLREWYGTDPTKKRSYFGLS